MYNYSKEELIILHQQYQQDLARLGSVPNFVQNSILQFLEESIRTQYIKVIYHHDEDDDFIIPNDLYDEFCKDLLNFDQIDSTEFEGKWGMYRTSTNSNIYQLYIKDEQKF